LSDARIIFDGVGKKFRRGERHYDLRELFSAFVRRLYRRAPVTGHAEEFWAVKGLSFEVATGDALAIIGPNGAGKSTSLKLATQILQPEEGQIDVRGRIGALIELAAGFHPDLTGRENIFLQGAIMGMTRRDILRRMDDIVAFAGVEQFVDTPVKRYSSGMNARLGFSIAAHLEPDVLIIDEVLSVGDMTFQERCIDRMIRFRREGVPILFVSHNLQAVSMLCNKAVYLQREMQAFGPTEDVLRTYVTRSYTAEGAMLTGSVAIDHTELLGDGDLQKRGVAPGTPLVLRVTYTAREHVSDLTLGFVVHRSNDMLVVYDAHYTTAELGIPTVSPGQSFTVDYAFRVNLTRGNYFLDCHVLHNPTSVFLSRMAPAGTFSVHETRTWTGVADLGLEAVLVRSARDQSGWLERHEPAGCGGSTRC
jgi:lipopolysaccharide transport system ATP-binding protein